MADKKVTFDIVARTDRATRPIRQLGDQVDDTSGRFSRFAGVAGKVAKVAGVALVAAVGAAGVVLVKAARAAADEEQEMAVLANTLTKATGATKAQVSSTETWITKLQNATGVADGELRPALGKLAIATGDVQKSQDLLNIALDIAAARGKPLSTVVEALGKAATGTTGGLGRLGLATKDAGGEALTFDQILKNASQTMGGAAAAAANTTSGRMAILKARFADLQEEIGARVLPILNRFLGWILDKGIPALRDLSGWFNEHVTPALRRLGTYINDKLVPAFQTMINDIWPTVQKNLQAMADDARSLASAFNHLSGKTNSTSDNVNILGLALKALSTIAAGVFDDIAQSVRWILFPIQKVNEALQAMIAWIRSIPDAIAGLKSAFNGIPDAIKNRIPGLAVGTRNFSGGLAVVGERGPELVSLPRGANVYTASETRRMTRTPSAAPGVDSGGIAAAVATAMASLSWRVDLDPSGVARIVAVGNKQIARRG